MKAISKLMVGGAAVAALVTAVPATAQYGGYGNSNTGSGVVGQIINQVLGYGRYPYGNYGYGQQNYSSSQTAVSQCASAAEQRIQGGGYGNNGYNNGYGNNGYNNGYGNNGYNNGYGNNGYGNNGYGNNGYNNGYGNNGYNNGYGNNGYGNNNGYGYNNGGNSGARVLGINSVEQKGYNRIKIVGVASSGRNYDRPYGYGSYSYNSNYGVPDLKFVCNADQSGRVYDVRIKANDGRR